VCVASGSARFIGSGETVDFIFWRERGGGGTRVVEVLSQRRLQSGWLRALQPRPSRTGYANSVLTGVTGLTRAHFYYVAFVVHCFYMAFVVHCFYVAFVVHCFYVTFVVRCFLPQ
jgi:hypothetical protein